MFEEPLQLFCKDLYLWSHAAREAEVNRGGNVWLLPKVMNPCQWVQVLIMRIKRQGDWLLEWERSDVQHFLYLENDKGKKPKIWKAYFPYFTLISYFSASLPLTPFFQFFLHQDDKEGGSSSWDKGPHSRMRTHTRTHTRTNTQEHRGLLSYTSH